MSSFSQMTQAEVDLHNARIAGVRLWAGEPSADAVQCESDLHYAILEECKHRGWLCFYGSMAHATRRTLGEPDFTILADRGRVFLIECKAKGGKMSPAQKGVELAAIILGHKVHVVSSLTQFFEIIEPPTKNPV